MYGDANSKPEERERAWEGQDCQDNNKKVNAFNLIFL
jgi:hypothetical protein